MGARERAQLEEWVRAKNSPRRLIFRSKICLLAAEGMSNSQIAQRLHTSRATVRLWKQRFLESGPEALLHDAPRGPSPKKISERIRAEIIKAATRFEGTQGSRWTTRTLAKALGVSNATVWRVWRSHGIGAATQRSRSRFVWGTQEAVGSEIIGIYAAPATLVVVTRETRKGVNVAPWQDCDRKSSSTIHLREKVDEAGVRAHGPRMGGVADISEKICFRPMDGAVGHKNLRAFLEPFARLGSTHGRSHILLFASSQEVQSVAKSVAGSSPGVELRILPFAPIGDACSQRVLCEQLERLGLTIDPLKMEGLLEAINALTGHAYSDEEPLVRSGLCPTLQEGHAAQTVFRTIKALGHNSMISSHQPGRTLVSYAGLEEFP